MNKLIPIGADHAGFELKSKVIEFLKGKGYEVKDFGCHSEDSIDYPDFGHPVASLVEENEAMLGILICGSGNGINMTANKHQGVRSALCWNAELAQLSREHNNANIITLPARFISDEEAIKMVNVFLETAFEGGRHERRVNKIACQ
ncbi:MAG: ribose 5-phosphate isomerase B [Crocinitomicaceae bacterium]|nr:ribose 5-phosphate isomerase B [Crocinitomicaceae bacterium]